MTFDLAQIAKVIINDRSLPAKMLRLLSSPTYGLRQQVRTIPHALALLGINAVRRLALSFSLAAEVRGKSQSGVNLVLYWKRSVMSAVAARELAAVAGSAAAKDEVFLAALLQIGRLALLRAVPELYVPLSPPKTDAEGAMVVAERVRNLVEGAVHTIASGQPAGHGFAGCATSGGREPFPSPAELVESADRALYGAK